MISVCVTWVDIVSDGGGWSTLSEALTYRPLTVETQGWIIQETEDFITVISTLSPAIEDEEPAVGGIHAIPRGCIINIAQTSHSPS
jgi:hypothetical protein